MLLMVIISGQGTMRSPRRLFPDRHQRIACVCLLRIRASVIPSTYYSAVLIVLYRCILLCWEDGKLHVESVNGRTVYVPLRCLGVYALRDRINITLIFTGTV